MPPAGFRGRAPCFKKEFSRASTACAKTGLHPPHPRPPSLGGAIICAPFEKIRNLSGGCLLLHKKADNAVCRPRARGRPRVCFAFGRGFSACILVSFEVSAKRQPRGFPCVNVFRRCAGSPYRQPMSWLFFLWSWRFPFCFAATIVHVLRVPCILRLAFGPALFFFCFFCRPSDKLHIMATPSKRPPANAIGQRAPWSHI